MDRDVDEGGWVASLCFDSDVGSSSGSPLRGVLVLLGFVHGELHSPLFVIGPEGGFSGHVPDVEAQAIVPLVDRDGASRAPGRWIV